MSDDNSQLSELWESYKLLTGKAHVRKRPGMYIGGTDQIALHELVWVILSYGLNQALAGSCSEIRTTLVADDRIIIHCVGFAFGVESNQDDGRTELEFNAEEIGGDTHNGELALQNGGMLGVELPVINALCRTLDINVMRNGEHWHIGYEKGDCTSPLHKLASTEASNTDSVTFAFSPDYTIFKTHPFDYDLIRYRIREFAFLVDSPVYHLIDQRTAETTHIVFDYEDGYSAFIALLHRDEDVLHDPVIIRKDVASTPDFQHHTITIAFQYVKRDRPAFIVNYVNLDGCSKGGVHVDMILHTLAQHIDLPDDEETFAIGTVWNFPLSNPLEHRLAHLGLTAVVSVGHPRPEYCGAAKNHLLSPEVKVNVEQMMDDFLSTNPKIVAIIKQHIFDIAENRKHRLKG